MKKDFNKKSIHTFIILTLSFVYSNANARTQKGIYDYNSVHNSAYYEQNYSSESIFTNDKIYRFENCQRSTYLSAYRSGNTCGSSDKSIITIENNAGKIKSIDLKTIFKVLDQDYGVDFAYGDHFLLLSLNSGISGLSISDPKNISNQYTTFVTINLNKLFSDETDYVTDMTYLLKNSNFSVYPNPFYLNNEFYVTYGKTKNNSNKINLLRFNPKNITKVDRLNIKTDNSDINFLFKNRYLLFEKTRENDRLFSYAPVMDLGGGSLSSKLEFIIDLKTFQVVRSNLITQTIAPYNQLQSKFVFQRANDPKLYIFRTYNSMLMNSDVFEIYSLDLQNNIERLIYEHNHYQYYADFNIGDIKVQYYLNSNMPYLNILDGSHGISNIDINLSNLEVILNMERGTNPIRK